MIRIDVQEQIVRILDELETYFISANKFDWLTMCGILASLLISSVAIWFSLKTSKRQEKILQKQNDISLFEKRYEVYLALLNIAVPIYNSATNKKNSDDFIKYLLLKIEFDDSSYMKFERVKESIINEEENQDSILSISKDILLEIELERLKVESFLNNIEVLHRAMFLFDNEISYEIRKFIDCILDLKEKLVWEKIRKTSEIYEFDYNRDLVLEESDKAIKLAREKISEQLKVK